MYWQKRRAAGLLLSTMWQEISIDSYAACRRRVPATSIGQYHLQQMLVESDESRGTRLNTDLLLQEY